MASSRTLFRNAIWIEIVKTESIPEMYYPEERKRQEEINYYIYHKCPSCGRFMKKSKTLEEQLAYGDYKCVLMTYHWEYGWEHD